VTDPWANRAFLRGSQYQTDANLAARQSIYAYQHPHIDLVARVLDLAGPAPDGTVVDVGCGNGMYLRELVSRGFPGRILGLDLSAGMLSAARHRLTAAAPPDPAASPGAAAPPGPAASPGAAGPHGRAAPPGPAGPRAAAAALAVADATALPLANGAVTLALAMHMLYHVPDPVDAVRELRRVTRPGGRVVIGLNGPGHLRQLRAAVARVTGTDPAPLVERIGLDDGETLARSFFARVTRHDFVAELRVPSAGPVADYLRSTAGTSHAVDPEQVAAVLAAIPRSPEGHFVITSHAGCLLADVG
jgi:SAM-dependent methyltransferase